jgi:hypothetical protein
MRTRPSIPAAKPARASLRSTLACLAAGALAFNGWLVAVEAVRPTIPAQALDLQQALDAAQIRERLLLAARIGMVRGDVWTEAASAFAAQVWRPPPQPLAEETSEARRAARSAVVHAPHRAEAWVLHAALAPPPRGQESGRIESVRMSYLTGFNDLHLAPLRFLAAARSGALADQEVQEMVRRELRLAAARRPALRPPLREAYASAPPADRRFIEQALADAGSPVSRSILAP